MLKIYQWDGLGWDKNLQKHLYWQSQLVNFSLVNQTRPDQIRLQSPRPNSKTCVLVSCVCCVWLFFLFFCSLNFWAWFAFAAFKSLGVSSHTAYVSHSLLAAVQDIIFVLNLRYPNLWTGFNLWIKIIFHLGNVFWCVRQWEGVLLGLIGGILSSPAGHFSSIHPPPPARSNFKI